MLIVRRSAIVSNIATFFFGVSFFVFVTFIFLFLFYTVGSCTRCHYRRNSAYEDLDREVFSSEDEDAMKEFYEKEGWFSSCIII